MQRRVPASVERIDKGAIVEEDPRQRKAGARGDGAVQRRLGVDGVHGRSVFKEVSRDSDAAPLDCFPERIVGISISSMLQKESDDTGALRTDCAEKGGRTERTGDKPGIHVNTAGERKLSLMEVALRGSPEQSRDFAVGLDGEFVHDGGEGDGEGTVSEDEGSEVARLVFEVGGDKEDDLPGEDIERHVAAMVETGGMSVRVHCRNTDLYKQHHHYGHHGHYYYRL